MSNVDNKFLNATLMEVCRTSKKIC